MRDASDGRVCVDVDADVDVNVDVDPVVSPSLTSLPVVFSITAIRFAIRTLSICAIDMIFPFPLTCVAALIVISGVSSSSFSSSSTASYGFRILGSGACGSTTVWYAGGAGMSSVSSDLLDVRDDD